MKMERIKSSVSKKWLTMIGVSLMMPSTGLNMIWSNLSIYTLSYIAVRDDSHWGITSPWISLSFLFMRNISWLFAGVLTTRIPKRAIVLIGIACSILAYVLAYFCVKRSLLLMTFTFGVTNGISAGIFSGVCLQYAVDWADGKSGLYTSIARGAMALGSVPFNEFITIYTNPSNDVPNILVEGTRLFSQDEILDRLPYTYLIIGIALLVLQSIGFFMLHEKNDVSPKEAPPGNYNSMGTDRVDEETINQQDSLPPNGSLSNGSPSNGSPPQALHTASTQVTSEYTTREMIRTKDFYIVVISMILGFYSYLVRFRYFKMYGELYIDNDSALTILVSCVLIGIVLMAIVWGIIIDKYGSKMCLIGYHSSVSVLNFIFYFSPIIHPWFYYVTAFIMSGVIAPFITLHTGVVANLFGRMCYAMNLGLILCASTVVCLVSTPIFGALLEIGWFYLYAACSVLSLLALVAVINLSNKL